MDETAIEKKENKIFNFFFRWVQDNYDKFFLLILAVAFIIRFWIFLKTMNQPLWWDEADYLSVGKRLGLGLDIRDIWYYRRGFLFPLISALFFKFGYGEIGIRFIEVLFSTGIVLISYIWISEMFNKKLALWTSVALTFSWILLFFTGRILTDIPAAFFILLSFMLFWKGYILKKGDKYLYISLAIFALAVLTRMQSLMMAPAFIAIVFPREKFRIFLNKRLWIAFGIFIVLLIPHFTIYAFHYGNPISDIAIHYLGIGEKAAETLDTRTFSIETFNYLFNLPYVLDASAPFASVNNNETNFNFPWLFDSWFFYLLLIGFFYFFSDLILGFDKFFHSEELQKKFFVLFFLACLFLIMGYIGSVSYVEQRYITVGLPFLFLIAISPFLKIGEFLEKNSGFERKTSVIIIAVIIALLMFPNFNISNKMLDEKKLSYIEVKEAGLWMKENSNSGDIIISGSLPQTVYYSERSVYPFGLDYKRDQSRENNEEDMLQFILEKKPKYYVVSSFESEPQWTFDFPEKNKDLLTPVMVYKQNDQPVLVIYQFNYDNYSA